LAQNQPAWITGNLDHNVETPAPLKVSNELEEILLETPEELATEGVWDESVVWLGPEQH
jgi:hypothetical protein